MKRLAWMALAGIGMWVLGGVADVVVENADCRLVLSERGYATSLVEKSTGEECLVAGAKVPFATLTQNRPYDNEYKLMLPAKPWTHRANRITRCGDELRIAFEDEFDVAVVKVEEKPGYIGFRLDRVDYRLEDFGCKRRTEIDALALVRLPLRRRGHFGSTLNVTWDDRVASALIASRCETRVDAEEREDGNLLFWAGTEERSGIMDFSAALVTGPKNGFLDAVDAVERDFGLPRGVASRRRADAAESCLFATDFCPERADFHLACAIEGGFRLLMFDLTDVVETTGSYRIRDRWPGGMEGLAAFAEKARGKGVEVAVHAYPTKASVTDPLVAGGRPDPRFNVVCRLPLHAAADAASADVEVEGNRSLLRPENGRRLVRIGDELVLFGGTTEPNAANVFALTNCVRGAMGTKAVAHARGEVAVHLDVDDWPIWVRFDQDTSIQGEAAERIAAYWKAMGLVQCYFDGAEDVPEPYWYYVPRAQLAVYERLDPTPRWCQSALKSHFGWHVNSRGNAFDVFRPERLREAMRKYVLRCAARDADDFSRVDFGWLDMRLPEKVVPSPRPRGSVFVTTGDETNLGIGMQPDHFEYVFSKAAAWDCPVTVQNASANRRHPRRADNFLVMRRWQEAVRARRFAEGRLAALGDPDREFFLMDFGGAAPELVEVKRVTADAERPLRAFSFERGGRAGIVYWNMFDSATPEIRLDLAGFESSADGGRRILAAQVPVADLVRAFRRGTRYATPNACRFGD